MPNHGEVLYAFRSHYPDVLERTRTQRVRLEAVRDGALVAPSAGTFTLVGPGGSTVVTGAVTIESSVAVYDIDASDLPTTLAFSELYQERWALTMPDGTVRTVTRECAVAPYQLHLPVADQDLLADYPDLVTQFAGQATTLQPFIDEAWRVVLDKLFGVGRWPDVMLSTASFVTPVKEEALYRAYRALFRAQTGSATNRWERLMDDHKAAAAAAWSALSTRIDRNLDGLPDGAGREGATGIVHRNAGASGSLRRSRMW